MGCDNTLKTKAWEAFEKKKFQQTEVLIKEDEWLTLQKEH